MHILIIFSLSITFYCTTFAIIYFTLKKRIAKSNLLNYYYKLSDSSTDVILIWLKRISWCFTLISITLIVSIYIYFFYNNNTFHLLPNYIFSKSALRLQKYLLEILLTFIGIVFTTITIFISMNPKYSSLFSTNDLIKFMNIKNDSSSCFFSYFMLLSSTIINYSCYYISISENASKIIKVFSFSFSITFSLICFYFIINLLHKFTKYVFSNSIEQNNLNSLYKNIYNKNLQPISQICKYDNSIVFLLSNFETTCNDKKIEFISSNTVLKSFKYKIIIALYTAFMSFLVNLALVVLMMSIISFKKEYSYIINTLLSTEIIRPIIFLFMFHFIFSTILYFNKCQKTGDLKTLLLQGCMFSWGFKVELPTKKHSKIYYSNIYSGFLTNKEYNQYFRDLYNILVILKRAIITSQECAKFYLDQIISEINAGKGDYLLYGISLYLYQEKYKLERKYKNTYLEYLEKHNLNHELVKNNMCAVLEDIDRANETSPSNENKNKTEHEIKKEKIRKKVESFFDSMKKIKLPNQIKNKIFVNKQHCKFSTHIKSFDF